MIIVVHIVWTVVALAAFVIGLLEGRKARHRYDIEAGCYTCGDRFTFPAHYTRDMIGEFMVWHSGWHDRQVTE